MTGATSHTNQVQAMRFKSQTAFSDPSAEVYQILGGKSLLPVEVRDCVGAHHAIQNGLSVHSVFYLADGMKHRSSLEILSQVVGLKPRTLQRKRNSNTRNAKLSTAQGNRLWNFAALLARATEVFGDPEEAENWILRPSIGLNNQRPIDLLRSSPGITATKQLLLQIDHGTYV